MKTKHYFHLGGWLGKTLIYVLLSLIHSNYLKFYFFLSLNLSFFPFQLQEMFKSIAVTLCRVFITQQKISTPLSV